MEVVYVILIACCFGSGGVFTTQTKCSSSAKCTDVLNGLVTLTNDEAYKYESFNVKDLTGGRVADDVAVELSIEKSPLMIAYDLKYENDVVGGISESVYEYSWETAGGSQVFDRPDFDPHRCQSKHPANFKSATHAFANQITPGIRTLLDGGRVCGCKETGWGFSSYSHSQRAKLNCNAWPAVFKPGSTTWATRHCPTLETPLYKVYSIKDWKWEYQVTIKIQWSNNQFEPPPPPPPPPPSAPPSAPPLPRYPDDQGDDRENPRARGANGSPFSGSRDGAGGKRNLGEMSIDESGSDLFEKESDTQQEEGIKQMQTRVYHLNWTNPEVYDEKFDFHFKILFSSPQFGNLPPDLHSTHYVFIPQTSQDEISLTNGDTGDQPTHSGSEEGMPKEAKLEVPIVGEDDDVDDPLPSTGGDPLSSKGGDALSSKGGGSPRGSNRSNRMDKGKQTKSSSLDDLIKSRMTKEELELDKKKSVSLLVPRERVDLTGRSCDKIGVSLFKWADEIVSNEEGGHAWVAGENFCTHKPGTCIGFQPNDLLESDKRRIAKKETPLYILAHQQLEGWSSASEKNRGPYLFSDRAILSRRDGPKTTTVVLEPGGAESPEVEGGSSMPPTVEEDIGVNTGVNHTRVRPPRLLSGVSEAGGANDAGGVDDKSASALLAWSTDHAHSTQVEMSLSTSKIARIPSVAKGKFETVVSHEVSPGGLSSVVAVVRNEDKTKRSKFTVTLKSCALLATTAEGEDAEALKQSSPRSLFAAPVSKLIPPSRAEIIILSLERAVGTGAVEYDCTLGLLDAEGGVLQNHRVVIGFGARAEDIRNIAVDAVEGVAKVNTYQVDMPPPSASYSPGQEGECSCAIGSVFCYAAHLVECTAFIRRVVMISAIGIGGFLLFIALVPCLSQLLVSFVIYTRSQLSKGVHQASSTFTNKQQQQRQSTPRAAADISRREAITSLENAESDVYTPHTTRRHPAANNECRQTHVCGGLVSPSGDFGDFPHSGFSRVRSRRASRKRGSSADTPAWPTSQSYFEQSVSRGRSRRPSRNAENYEEEEASSHVVKIKPQGSRRAARRNGGGNEKMGFSSRPTTSMSGAPHHSLRMDQ